MLRTNFSTRPFYNERLVFLGLSLAALLVAALTFFNAYRFVTLTRRDRALAGTTVATEQSVQKLRQEAARTRATINRSELEVVAAAAREANALIDERTFSWTELLNRFEETLPPDVRIESIAPVPNREGTLQIRVVVQAHRAEDVDTFVDNLEKKGNFRQVVSQSETTNPQGLLEVSLQGEYLPKTGVSAGQ